MSQSSAPPLVQLRQAYKYYQLGEQRITALNGVDLSIGTGEFVAIWGPSGSGKSTLCNMIGLLDRPSSGTVKLNGVDASKLSDDQRSAARNRSIGFIFQNFNLLPVLSALENVMLPLQIGHVDSAEAKRAAIARLEEVGLAGHMKHRPAKLSGGQQQRVAIARALITHPALVVADEPTANLDSENALMIIDLMRKISQREGTTFVFSTHDERLLGRVDRQVMMRDGVAVADRHLAPVAPGSVARAFS
jgi:putative ABC transport system ATP-binding protein